MQSRLHTRDVSQFVDHDSPYILGFLDVSTCDKDGGAPGQKFFGRLGTDTTTAARDQNNLSINARGARTILILEPVPEAHKVPKKGHSLVKAKGQGHVGQRQ